MMKCEIRAGDTLHIEGYVNAVERDSDPLIAPNIGKCVEQIRAGAFGEALASGDDVEILENHDRSRKLGSTADGNLLLYEDPIGLRAAADITDREIIKKARTGQLKGWSFGFIPTDTEVETRADNLPPRRIIKSMKLSEVSLIDGKYKPCYPGTLVEVRTDCMVEYRCDEDIEIIEEAAADYGYYERCIDLHRQISLDILSDVCYDYFKELRYNPYHDPGNGRFTSGGGGGGASGDYIMMVPKGAKGNGILVKDAGLTDNKEASDYYHYVYANSSINNGKHNLVNGVNQLNTTSAVSESEGAKFGVSGGIGTAYTIVSTSEGNKLIRNDYISYRQDGTLYISNKSNSVPRDATAIKSKITEISSSEHSANPSLISSVAKGDAMSFEQANSGNANPNFEKSINYKRNCQTCVPVFMARQRGYDIEAKPRRSDSELTMKALSYDTTLAYIDPTTGKPPAVSSISLSNAGDTLNTSVSQGQTFAVQFSRRSGSGHIITASRTSDDKIRLYDPQPSKSVTGVSEINKYFTSQKVSSIEIYRIDNLDFNETVMNDISKPRSK